MQVFPGLHEVGTLSKLLRDNAFEEMSRAEARDWLIRFCAYYDAVTIVLMELSAAKALGNASGVVQILENRVQPLLREVLGEGLS